MQTVASSALSTSLNNTNIVCRDKTYEFYFLKLEQIFDIFLIYYKTKIKVSQVYLLAPDHEYFGYINALHYLSYPAKMALTWYLYSADLFSAVLGQGKYLFEYIKTPHKYAYVIKGEGGWYYYNQVTSPAYGEARGSVTE